MLQLFRLRGFASLAIVLFINTFVELGYKILVQNTIFKIYNGQSQVILTAIVNALILIPFIILFSPAGFIADKYPKQQVMRYRAFFAVGMILLAIVMFYQGWFWAAFVMMFAWGVLATVYSPAKYGYIRELVGEQYLASANGLMQALGISAILIATFIVSFLFEYCVADIAVHDMKTILQNVAPIGWLLLMLTVIELLSYW